MSDSVQSPSPLWLGLPRHHIRESKAEYNVDILRHHNAKIKDTLIEKLGGLPVVPSSLFSFFNAKQNSLLFCCKNCKSGLYLVCQLKDRQDGERLRIDYLFVCNSSVCLKRIDAWKDSILCLSFEKPIVQSNLPKKDPVKSVVKDRDSIDGESIFGGPLILDCNQSLKNLNSLMDNLALKTNKIANATPLASTMRQSQKQEALKWVIMNDFSPSFPPIPVYFHEELSSPHDDSDDGDIATEAEEGTSYLFDSCGSDEGELYENIVPKQISETFYSFQRCISMNPLQVLRCSQSPLLAVDILGATKCAQCQATLKFQWQVMPAFFHCIDVEDFCIERRSEKSVGKRSILDLLKSNGMDWSTILVYICQHCPSQPVPSTPDWTYRQARVIIQNES